jgi:hypothetical protein
VLAAAPTCGLATAISITSRPAKPQRTSALTEGPRRPLR